MTKTFYFIRHGESQSNAGDKTLHPATILLTQKGLVQAKAAAHSFPGKPDAVVTSRYIRTKQTAEFLLERFQDVSQLEWNIHEFTYLSAEKYKDTTNIERYPFTDAYWKKADPLYQEDDSAESFAAFVGRCSEAVEQMKSYEAKRVAVFSHGYFMNGLRWLLEERVLRVDSQAMRDFRSYHLLHSIQNCSRLEFTVEKNKTVSYRGDRVEGSALLRTI